MTVEEVFTRHHVWLVKSMESFSGDDALAEDSVSHAFIKALENEDLLILMPEGTLKAWMYTCARNFVTDSIRKRKRLSFYEEIPESGSSGSEEEVLMRMLLEELSEDLKAIVAMRYYNAMNSSEIGEALGIPASTVRYKLSIALKTLRGMIKEK